jgi:Lipocalin-like domain
VSAQPNGIAARFHGAWRYAGTTIDGQFRTDRGGEPVGIIIYDASGHMSVQVMPGREQRPTAPISAFLSYFGTYTIDERAQTVTHHREGDLRTDAPIEVVRQYKFDGNRLILSPVGTTQDIIWERIR